MPNQTVEALIEGGKATAAPPLGPALGPLGLNISQVVQEINKKTASFAGMQVPIKVSVDTSTKAFTISVGTPPASALIKKEARLEKGSGSPLADKVADLRIEQIIKIAKMKEDSLLGRALKNKVKEIIGTCQSMGVLVGGVPVPDALKLVEAGRYDEEIRLEKTELTAEELRQLEEEKERLAAGLEKKRLESEKIAKDIISQMTGKENSKIRSKLLEAGIPKSVVDALVPAEKKAAEGSAPPSAAKK